MHRHALLGQFILQLLLLACAHAEPVKIGVLTDLSGNMAFWGRQTILGAEMARDEINKDGEHVVLVVGDHQLQAKSAISEYQKLTDLDHVDGIYLEFTPASVAVAPLSATKKMPIIYSAAATSPLTTSPMMYKTFLDYVAGCAQIAEYWKGLGIKRVGILKPNIEFGELCLSGVKKIYPDLTEQIFNPGDEVSGQVLALRTSGVEAVISSAFEPDLQRLLKSMRNLKWTPFVGTQRDLISPQIKESFPEFLPKIVGFSLPILPTSFTDQLLKRDPNNTLVSVSAAGLGYLHVTQLYSALSKCSSTNSHSACVMNSIAEAKPDQQVGFNGWKDRIASFNIPLVTWPNGNGDPVVIRSTT